MAKVENIGVTVAATKARKRADNGALKIMLYRFGLLFGILGLWELGIRTGYLEPYIYGVPSGVAQAFATQVMDGSLAHHFWVTFQEV